MSYNTFHKHQCHYAITSDTGCHCDVINSDAHAEHGMCKDAHVVQRCGLLKQLCLDQLLGSLALRLLMTCT